MTRDEHLAAAEEILRRWQNDIGPNTLAPMARAQVHATLATIADEAPPAEPRVGGHVGSTSKALRIIELLKVDLAPADKVVAIDEIRKVIAS